MPELTKDRIGFDPGPWEVRKTAFIIVEAVKSGNIICGCGAMNYPSQWLIQKSLCNARLIKAAPDMYKMLNRFATYFKERGFNTPRTCTLPTPEEVCNLIDEIDGKEIVR